jgi:hypothetical protein
MNKFLSVVGLVCGAIVLAGVFTPWLELHSNPYKLEKAKVKDYLVVNGWDLIQGNIRVVQMIESVELLRWEYYRTIELRVESKSYPYLSLVGGFLLILGGVCALRSEGRTSYLAIVSGGLLAFAGGFLGFWLNRWITPRVIVIEQYTVFGYYRYGLLLCIIGSLAGIVGCSFIWSASQKEQPL